MNTYACVRTDNMSGTTLGKNLVSVKYDGEIENGCIVAVGDYVDGEREVRVASAPAVNADVRNLALIASPEVIKDKDNYALSDFVNEAGSICRGYRLISGDMFSLTKEAFADGATLAKGSIVELNGTVKLNAVASASGDATAIGSIKAVEGDWYVIEVA